MEELEDEVFRLERDEKRLVGLNQSVEQLGMNKRDERRSEVLNSSVLLT